MHHAVVKVKWTLALSEPSSPDGVKGNLHDARSEQEYMEGEMVMNTTLVKLRRKVMASSSRLPMRGARKIWRCQNLAEARHA